MQGASDGDSKMACVDILSNVCTVPFSIKGSMNATVEGWEQSANRGWGEGLRVE